MKEKATPHTRGSTLKDQETIYHIGGYPAYAGIDPIPRRAERRRIRLPRIRGDRPGRSWRRWYSRPATPHTRGSTLYPIQNGIFRRGYPAYAGIDPKRHILV